MTMGPWGLHHAIPDTCKNYKPIKDQYTGVSSNKLGRINKCENWKIDPKYWVKKKQDNACCWCKNRTD